MPYDVPRSNRSVGSATYASPPPLLLHGQCWASGGFVVVNRRNPAKYLRAEKVVMTMGRTISITNSRCFILWLFRLQFNARHSENQKGNRLTRTHNRRDRGKLQEWRKQWRRQPKWHEVVTTFTVKCLRGATSRVARHSQRTPTVDHSQRIFPPDEHDMLTDQ